MSQFTSLHTVAACLTIPSPLSRADVKRCWTKGSEITDAVLHISLSVTFTLFLCLLVAYGIPAHCSLCCLYAPPRTKLCPGPCCVLSSLCQGQLLRQLYKYLLKLPDNMGGGGIHCEPSFRVRFSSGWMDQRLWWGPPPLLLSQYFLQRRWGT